MGKIIGVLNQKGGVGKSILTMLMATNIHLGENKKKDKNFVSIFDGDYPQHSIYDTRADEKKILTERIENPNDYFIRRYKNQYYDGFEPLTIYTGSITDIYNDFDKLREKHAYTFVDVVGTINVAGYDHKFLGNFDYILVPTNLDYKIFKGTLKFVKNFVHPLYLSKKVNYSILLNNVDGREKIAAESTHEDIKSIDYPIMDTIIYRNKKYASLYLDNKAGSKASTIFNITDNNINKLVKELITKI